MLTLLFIAAGILGFSSPSTAAGSDDYPSQWKTPAIDTIVDSWGYYNWECTSFVAYRLGSENGFTMPRAIGDASAWGTKASSLGYAVNTTPAVGSVAWWSSSNTSGIAGHVAWVESVGAGTVTVEQYNIPNRSGAYSKKTYATSSISGFIHFKDITGATKGTASSFSGDNKADILWYEAVSNGQGKVITTNGSGDGTSSANTWFTGWSKPDWKATGDFNGDGKDDIAWYEASNNGSMKVILTNSVGTGTASAYTWFSGWSSPDWASVGDFNGDGKDDLAWYEGWNNGGTMKVIQTNSAGTGTGSAYTWFSGWSAPSWAGLGDFNGDGKTDLLWYESWNNNGTAKVLYTNNAGTGGTNGTTWFSGFSAPDYADIGDFTGDSKADIVWYEGWNNGTAKVISTNSSGSGTGQSYTWFSGFAKPTWAVIG